MIKFETKVENLVNKADHLFIVGSEKLLKKFVKADLVGKAVASLVSGYLKETKGGFKGVKMTTSNGKECKL